MGIAVRAVADEDDIRVSQAHLEVSTREINAGLLQLRSSELDGLLIRLLRRCSIPALRLTLGVVFLWFGALKLLGLSPVLPLVQETYPFMPLHPFFLLLGFWEMGIGCGLIFKRALRITLVLLCVHLTGTFIALVLAPPLFFLHHNPLWLTTEGEFVMKNLVLVAAGLVIGGHEVRPRAKANGIRTVEK